MEQPPSISLYERTEDDTSALGDGIAKLSLDQIDDHPTEVSLFDEEEEEEKVSESKTSKYAYSENANLAEENGKVYNNVEILKISRRIITVWIILLFTNFIFSSTRFA